LAFLVLWALRGEKIPGKNSAGLNGEDLGQYHFVLTNYVIYVWETTMKITKNELIEIIKEEVENMMSEDEEFKGHASPEKSREIVQSGKAVLAAIRNFKGLIPGEVALAFTDVLDDIENDMADIIKNYL